MKNSDDKKDDSAKKFFDKKTVLAAIVAVLMVIVAVAIIIVVNHQDPIPDGFFSSDNTKLVLSLSPEVSSFETNREYAPKVTRIVYFHDGDKVTNAKIYFEYSDDEAAKEADAHITMDDKNWATGRRRNGRYIVFSVKPDQYRGLTTDRVNDNIDSMKAAGGTIDE